VTDEQSGIFGRSSTLIEDDGPNVTIEIAEEDYLADLAAGRTEDETMKPGRYVFRRGSFLERHPQLKDKMRKG
jgi:hypothetical protein